tara:strand:- start:5030 stop:5767 length:738 start_codon:yes stop_codon:yes gene_type:complete
MKKLKTFKHSGDLGDIIFSLPVMIENGGGVLYLDPQGGEKESLVSWGPYNKTKLTKSSIENLKPLLEKQKYIHEVRLWEPGIEIDFNLDKFRKHIKHNNLTASHFDAFDMLDRLDRWQDKPWLRVTPKELPEGKKIILARSCRYHANFSFWEQLSDDYINSAVFVSLPKEFDYFLYTFPRYAGKIERLDTDSISDLAAYIQGCDLFIGNQGFPHAIAEAMKKNMINEAYKTYPSCIYKRANVQYV